MLLSFTVYGVPVPKGSAKAFVIRGRAAVTHDNPKTAPWGHAIVAAARDALDQAPDSHIWAPLEDPVALRAVFFMPRPKSASKRVLEPAKKPDLDKLLRCLKDGLTRAGVYHDDGQVTRTIAEKRFAGGLCDPWAGRGVPRLYVEVGVSTALEVTMRWSDQ